MPDNNEPLQPELANAKPLPVADLTAPASLGSVEYEAYPVRKPEEDLNDFRVQVRATTLARCRAKLAQVANPVFPWHEVALGGSTLTGGAFLGALPADLKTGSFASTFFYTLLPIVAVASFVAYIFLRRSALREPADAAAEVLAELPDPDRTR
jgi:hypothetical protein